MVYASFEGTYIRCACSSSRVFCTVASPQDAPCSWEPTAKARVGTSRKTQGRKGDGNLFRGARTMSSRHHLLFDARSAAPVGQTPRTAATGQNQGGRAKRDLRGRVMSDLMSRPPSCSQKDGPDTPWQLCGHKDHELPARFGPLRLR